MKPSTTGRGERAAPSISFRRELEALRAQRRVPLLAPALTIGGGIEQSVHTEIDKRRESRINSMETRLSEITNHAASVFTLAQLETRASRDFERSR